MTESQTKWGPLIVIEWLDSCSLKGGVWNHTEDVEKLTPDTCRSVGWILKEDKEGIVIVPHASSHQVGGEMCIPKSAIRRRWVLADPAKRKHR